MLTTAGASTQGGNPVHSRPVAEGSIRHAAELIDIAVFDDNPADISLIDTALRETGVQARLLTATDVEDALKLVNLIDNMELPCPPLVVLDLNFPNKCGFDVLNEFV